MKHVTIPYQVFLSKNNILSELRSYIPFHLQGHLLRSHYIVNICLNLLSNVGNQLNPLNCGWILSSEYMMPDKFELYMPEIFTKTCGCKKGFQRGCGCRRMGEFCTEYCSCNYSENIY